MKIYKVTFGRDGEMQQVATVQADRFSIDPDRGATFYPLAGPADCYFADVRSVVRQDEPAAATAPTVPPPSPFLPPPLQFVYPGGTAAPFPMRDTFTWTVGVGITGSTPLASEVPDA